MCRTLVHKKDFEFLTDLIPLGEEIVIATSDMVFDDSILETMKKVYDSDHNYGAVYCDFFRRIDDELLYIHNVSYSRGRVLVPIFGTIFSNDSFADVVSHLKKVESCNTETKLPLDLPMFTKYSPYHIPLPGFTV